MKWSETGQLLCNTPTMIIEGFLLLILIQAHNIANAARGADFQSLLKHRLLLNHYVWELSENSNRSSSPYPHNPSEKSVDITDFYPIDDDNNKDMKISVHEIEDRV